MFKLLLLAIAISNNPKPEDAKFVVQCFADKSEFALNVLTQYESRQDDVLAWDWEMAEVACLSLEIFYPEMCGPDGKCFTIFDAWRENPKANPLYKGGGYVRALKYCGEKERKNAK